MAGVGNRSTPTINQSTSNFTACLVLPDCDTFKAIIFPYFTPCKIEGKWWLSDWVNTTIHERYTEASLHCLPKQQCLSYFIIIKVNLTEFLTNVFIIQNSNLFQRQCLL